MKLTTLNVNNNMMRFEVAKYMYEYDNQLLLYPFNNFFSETVSSSYVTDLFHRK